MTVSRRDYFTERNPVPAGQRCCHIESFAKKSPRCRRKANRSIAAWDSFIGILIAYVCAKHGEAHPT